MNLEISAKDIDAIINILEEKRWELSREIDRRDAEGGSAPVAERLARRDAARLSGELQIALRNAKAKESLEAYRARLNA